MFAEGDAGEAINSDILLTQVVQLLQEIKMSGYLVGGAVRDRLLRAGGPAAMDWPHPYDLDFAVPGDGLRIARYIADSLDAAFYPLDAGRDVGRVVLPGDRGKERVVDVARFQGPDLAADLAGRDFTVNAMALEVTRDPPLFFDPHGGQADLEARLLRAVSDQAIHNDPARGLRAVRLVAELGFDIEPRTQALIQGAASGLRQVSAERVRDELVKILALPAVTNSLRRLDALHLLGVILPEVTALKGLAQTGHHRWDAYEHTLQTATVLETLLPVASTSLHPDVPFAEQVSSHIETIIAGGHSRRVLLTLAALLHDVGKRDTATLEPDGQTHFIGHERLGASMAAAATRRLRFAGDAVRLVETIVQGHLRPLQLAWQGVASKRAIYRFFRDTGEAGVEIALLSLADHCATVGPDMPGRLSMGQDKQYPELLKIVSALLDAYFNHQQSVVAPAPLLTGRDLIHRLGVKEGPALGRLLAALLEAQAIGQVTNRDEAEAWVKGKIEEWKAEG